MSGQAKNPLLRFLTCPLLPAGVKKRMPDRTNAALSRIGDYRQQSLTYWKQHPFFAPDTVVLGLDIGIEGIGICVRAGQRIIYFKTLLVNIPKSDALSARRAYRAARRARKNRRTRMSRLRRLFAKHGLPWVDDETYSRSDAFMLRYRALHGSNPLASREALSLCIRSAVGLRGYDYFAMCDSDGEYPWGATSKLEDAKKWLASAYIDQEMHEFLLEKAPDILTRTNKALNDQERENWRALVEKAVAENAEHSIDAMLHAYAKGRPLERKARGFKFPRSMVEEHLRSILSRHRHLIDDPQGFEDDLFLKCESKKDKKKAIFFFNRKTKKEAERHFAKKVKRCPYAADAVMRAELGLAPSLSCAEQGNQNIRRWKLVDFLSNRRFELQEKGKGISKETLPREAVAALIQALEDGRRWNDAQKALTDALKPKTLAKGSDWNEGAKAQLKDIYAPAQPSKRSGLSAEAAGRLFELATQCGNDPEPAAVEKWKKEWKLYEKRSVIQSAGGIYPQVRTLLGTVRKGGARSFATTGFLQHLFEKTLKGKLPAGKTRPDYVVVECVKSAPRNDTDKKELDKRIKKNRERKDCLAGEYHVDKWTRSKLYRVQLFEEQGGSPGDPARCPFTGESLGCDPFSPELEIAHLYPDSRGGLYVRENLVLTTCATNQAMGNRTPKEAAADAGLRRKGWKDWAAMERDSHAFDWGKAKRELFAFAPDDTRRFPDFNNLTRTAQLAAELRNLVAIWLGIAADSEAVRKRIGNPSGTYTAAARHGMLGSDYKKDRSDLTHHRNDAFVMSCIPPAEGINDVHCKGIFFTDEFPDGKGGRERRLSTIQGLPIPDIDAVPREDVECPIVKIRSRSKYNSLGDRTFYSVDEEGRTWQRTPLNGAEFVEKAKKGSAPTRDRLYGILQNDMHIPSKYRPSRGQIERWLLSQAKATQDDNACQPKPLRLRKGVPVKSIRNSGSKGNLDKSPIGWSGVITPKGKFDQLRNLNGRYERLELWIGWHPNKKAWRYQTRVIPTKRSMEGIRRMGLPWRGTQNAPAYLQKLLERTGKPDLRRLVCGSLQPHSVLVDKLCKGRLFRVFFSPDEKQRKKVPPLSDAACPVEAWGELSAIDKDKQIEINALTRKDLKKVRSSKSPEKLAEWLGYPPADVYAQQHGLTPPS